MQIKKQIEFQRSKEDANKIKLNNAITMTEAFLHSPLVRLVESKFRFRDQNIKIRFCNMNNNEIS
jgi:hypothetical protein